MIKLRGPLGEVLDQKITDRPALEAVGVDDLLDAAAAVQPQHPQPLGRRSREHAGLFQRRVEQRPARAAPEVMLLQRLGELDAVAHGDVANEATLVDHDPGELVQGVGPGPAGRVLHVGIQAAKALRVDSIARLGQHQHLPLP